MTIMRRELEALFGFFGRFLPSFTSAGFRARSLIWAPLNPGFSGQTWIVTGASGGIGAAITRQAIRHGADVIAVARSADKLEALANSVATERGNLIATAVDCSLSSEIREFVGGLDRAGTRADVLVNNVGVMLAERTETREGCETSFATNLLNHYLLTEALIAGNHMAGDAAIINMSSGGMYNVPLAIGSLEPAEKNYDGTLVYAAHKRAQVSLADYWQSKYGVKDINFYTMHPGWVDTPGVQFSMPQFRALLRHQLRTPDQGADTAIWLAATRPDPRADTIWFDRAPRPAHIFARTRRSATTPEELAAFLAKRLPSDDR